MTASIHDRKGLVALARRLKLDPYPLGRFKTRFLKQGRPAAEALGELPAPMREPFSAGVDFHPLALNAALDSKIDGATKLLFQTRTGNPLETVILRIATGRTTLCVSSQSGCAAACAFCATGTMGLKQNLSSAEILDQVVQAQQRLAPEGRQIRNLVFMGMGEPFHNEANLLAALDELSARDAFGFDPGRLLVSSVGVPDAMVRLARSRPKVRQALSLHSARQELRRQIMPLAERHSLADLRAALDEVVALQGKVAMIEYLLLAGVNDQPEDLAALTDYLAGLQVHINLIPYNATGGSLAGTVKADRERFAKALREAGFKVTLRYSLGSDIAAACGQLAKQKQASTDKR
jgi:23S rRNA (adenine2503-C2)-methyltransferase